ncbi:hypothetical protein M0R72_05770 [Candidatus Pacearchaeota archaeon]|jgi:transcription initiation factor TFIIIB Brf1 subunit/transcription initiation factor TFIIB|nr:hypothetical protein [Candidatus Pacearchaeota archaeon]
MRKRRYATGVKELIAIARATGTSRDTTREAVKLFRNTLRAKATPGDVVFGRSYIVFEIASLYIASRGTQDEHSMKEYVSAASELSESRQHISIRECNCAVTAQRELVGVCQYAYTSVDKYVRIITTRAGLSNDTCDKALELVDRYGDVPSVQKRHPRSIAAGMIYVATVTYKTDTITQPELSKYSGASLVTIRQVANAVRKKMTTKKSIRFTVRKA